MFIFIPPRSPTESHHVKLMGRSGGGSDVTGGGLFGIHLLSCFLDITMPGHSLGNRTGVCRMFSPASRTNSTAVFGAVSHLFTMKAGANGNCEGNNFMGLVVKDGNALRNKASSNVRVAGDFDGR